jgi:SAM-dependent methyltransferase
LPKFSFLKSGDLMLKILRQIQANSDATSQIQKDMEAMRAELKAVSVHQRQIARKVSPKPLAIPDVKFSRIPGEPTECPACTSASVSFMSGYPTNNPRFRMCVIFYCTACGSGYVPDAEEFISDYYKAEYSASNRRDRDMPPEAYFNQEKPEPRYARYFGRAKAQVSALAAHGAKFDRVLDYGSGPGYFLFECEAKRPFAVELDDSSNKYLDYLSAKNLAPNELGEKTMDVIVASHVVEHFTQKTLEQNLASMARALDVGGIMLIEVPHGGHSFGILNSKQEPHTLFFTPEGILKAVQRQGLHILAAYPRGTQEAPTRPEAIYTPDPNDDFASTQRDGLTIIAQRVAG